ncbi:MAG: response regulator [Treponema sp.]|nr:response regulator [Treponema sp.]
MKIITIDDSPPALDVLTEAIREACPDAEVFSFDDPYKLLDFAKETPCDIALLDIRMPGMNGLEAAVALKKIKPSTNIIFVTAYSQYAIEAMKLYPSGYVMKPAAKKAIEREIENLRHPVERKSDKRVRVQTFGNFEVFVDGKPLVFIRTRAKELFAYLIDRRGAAATAAEIAAALWEHKKYNKSLKSQTQAAISEMMKALKENGIDDIIIKSWNQISIDCEKISCDYYDLLNCDTRAVNAFCGEYMVNYGWAEMTTAALSRKTNIY